MEIRYLLSGYRTSSFTQNRRMECHYPIPFTCRFSINSLKSNFYCHYFGDFYRIYILFLFPLERTSPNIQSIQNVLTYTDRAPHWAPEMIHNNIYNISHLWVIFRLILHPFYLFCIKRIFISIYDINYIFTHLSLPFPH